MTSSRNCYDLTQVFLSSPPARPQCSACLQGGGLQQQPTDLPVKTHTCIAAARDSSRHSYQYQDAIRPSLHPSLTGHYHLQPVFTHSSSTASLFTNVTTTSNMLNKKTLTGPGVCLYIRWHKPLVQQTQQTPKNCVSIVYTVHVWCRPLAIQNVYSISYMHPWPLQFSSLTYCRSQCFEKSSKNVYSTSQARQWPWQIGKYRLRI